MAAPFGLDRAAWGTTLAMAADRPPRFASVLEFAFAVGHYLESAKRARPDLAAACEKEAGR
jgi:hypothetical protein